jgi:cytochrome b561
MQNQYSRRMAIIHWLTLLLFIAALYLGHELDEMEQATAKFGLYPFHFLIGDAVLVLTLLRAYFIRKDGKPAPIAGGSPLANKVATGLHHLLYGLLIAVPASGMIMLNTTGLLAALKARDVALMPDLETFAIHEIHAMLIFTLVATIALHAAAALYHQFLLKDGLMNRMSLLGKREPK